MNKLRLLKASYEGVLKLGESELQVYVLENGTRVISRNAIYRAFGRTKRGRKKDEIRVPDKPELPSFIDAKNLQPFIDNELERVLGKIDFLNLSGKEASGYEAVVIPLLCNVYLEARAQGVLTKQQEHLAAASEILVRSLAKTGIIALVDEATGYQYDREKAELQKILQAYISEELLPWQKRFPDVFYRELFRLNGWDFTVNGIKKRPSVIGKWTNTLVYDELPKGIREELKNKTPKSSKGNYTQRLHQSLTEDVGHPHLAEQISKVITLFQLSDNMKHMWQQFEKLKMRQQGQLEIPFEFDKEGRTIEPVEPIDESNLSDFNNSLKKALDFNPKED